LKTKAIAQARIKTDTLDARTLAHLLKSDLVAECAEVNGVEALLVDKAGNVQGTLSGGNFTCAIGRMPCEIHGTFNDITGRISFLATSPRCHLLFVSLLPQFKII